MHISKLTQFKLQELIQLQQFFGKWMKLQHLLQIIS